MDNVDNSNVCSVICGVLILAPSVLAVPFAETAFIRRAGLVFLRRQCVFGFLVHGVFCGLGANCAAGDFGVVVEMVFAGVWE